LAGGLAAIEKADARPAASAVPQTRFDVVSVLLAKPIRIEWQRDAFR